jgi:hypothetical protein
LSKVVLRRPVSSISVKLVTMFRPWALAAPIQRGLRQANVQARLGCQVPTACGSSGLLWEIGQSLGQLKRLRLASSSPSRRTSSSRLAVPGAAPCSAGWRHRRRKPARVHG